MDYETSGDSMRQVAERQGLSQPSVYRAVRNEREAMADIESRNEKRRFDLQRHVADVLIEQSELQLEAVQILRQRIRNGDFVERQSGRDWAAIVGTLAKENRATFDYIRRTFGDRAGEPAADAPTNPDTPEQYES